MPLIVNGTPTEYLVEQCLDPIFGKEKTGKMRWYFEGILLQQELINKNGRKYTADIMEPEVNRYVTSMVMSNRAVGELGHPDGPTINPERVSHKIISITKDGNNYIGKAMVSNSPFGKIAQNFLDEEIKFGVSSRAVGTLRRVNKIDLVQSDFHLATAADIVMDPSAPDAFVRGLMESKEYLFADGLIQEAKLDTWKRAIKTASQNSLRETELSAYTDFLNIVDKRFTF